LYKKIVADLLYDLDNAQTLFGGSFNIMAHYGFQSQQGSQADELRGAIMSKVGALKMLCSHPDLIRISAEKFIGPTGDGSQYAYDLMDGGHMDGVTKSNKLDSLIEYVKDFLDQRPDNKVVIFATYVEMTNMIQEKLGADICRTYTGKLDAKSKEDNKVAFNTDPSIRVLISSDAGGYGVDLPAANLLINYDMPWSSGLATQRNGRIKRASSTWETIVIQDFLIAGSIEVRQHDALQQKNSVANAVMDGEGIDSKGGVDLTLGTLRNFILNTSV
jgi:SNF2 family DNA or RNA helicase